VPAEAVRAIVETAKFSDPRATEYLVETILARKAKVMMLWLNGTNPVVDFSLDVEGRMRFRNASEIVGMAKAAERYTVQWARLDNATGTLTPVGAEQSITGLEAQAPRQLMSDRYIAATVRAFHPDHPAWQHPVIVYFRKAPDTTWTLVGLERNPS
jgi:hypothetical protein